VSDLDEIWETAERELETAWAKSEALDHLERDRDALMESSYAGMVSETLEDLTPEHTRRVPPDLQAAPAWCPLPPGLTSGDHRRLCAGGGGNRNGFVV
jgi:hypothetical protein